jgi:hypothetical protein
MLITLMKERVPQPRSLRIYWNHRIQSMVGKSKKFATPYFLMGKLWKFDFGGISSLWIWFWTQIFFKISLKKAESRLLYLIVHVMNHLGSTFSHNVSVWIQTHLSGTGLSWHHNVTFSRLKPSHRFWSRRLRVARYGIQKTLGTRNPYRWILVPRHATADTEAYMEYMTGCKPIGVWTTGYNDIKD